jgi:hypothetical protein
MHGQQNIKLVFKLYRVVLWQWFSMRNVIDTILNYFHRHCNKTYYTAFRKHTAFVLMFRCIHKKRDKEQAVTNTHKNHAKMASKLEWVTACLEDELIFGLKHIWLRG